MTPDMRPVSYVNIAKWCVGVFVWSVRVRTLALVSRGRGCNIRSGRECAHPRPTDHHHPPT